MEKITSTSQFIDAYYRCTLSLQHKGFIPHGKKEIGYADITLARLLKANQSHCINENLLEQDGDGHWFHKAFRAIDVTGNGDIDMAIWFLMQRADVFWLMIKKRTPVELHHLSENK